jgi:hypothetical protein
MLLSVMVVDGHPAVSLSFTLVGPCWNFSIHSYTLCHGKARPPYCAESFQWISAPGTPSDHKTWITARCFSLVQMESGTAILLRHSTKLNCVMMLKLSTGRDKGAICWHAHTESSTINPQNIKTHVRVLIDLPS